MRKPTTSTTAEVADVCGIAGFWTSRGTPDGEHVLAGMTETLRHRGPDAGGIWLDERHGVGLGHRRLSIVDLSVDGAQPMTSASGRYRIVYNGEIYNTDELRAAVGERRWRGHSDTEVLLAAVDAWGLDAALARFAGMFGFALWDQQEHALHLVRDRLGIKPLYYAHVAGGIVFGSELRAVRAFPGVDLTLDREAVGAFLRFDYVPGPRSIHAGVRKLPPGCTLTLRAPDARPEPRRYWDAVAVARAGAEHGTLRRPDDVVDELEALLQRVVGEHLVADVPLGAFLSGGIDSSLVVALTRSASRARLRTFSIGFDDAAFDESAHARAVAESLGTEHTELRVTAEQALAVVPQLASLYDEPFADSSQVPTYLLSALTRQHVTVSLSGDGGDELFAGYTRYARNASVWSRVRGLPRPMRWGARRLARHVSEPALDRALTPLRALLPGRLGRYASGERVRAAAALAGAESDQAVYEQLFTHLDPASALVARDGGGGNGGVGASWSAMPTHLQRMMQWDIATYLPDDILVKVDRASMAVGLEARVPLLDHRVAEFALRLPPEVATLGGVPKWPLRQLLSRHVPRALFERPKMGFGVPLGTWLRGPLREWMCDLLSPDRVRRRGLVDPGVVERRLRDHLSGRVEYGFALWNLLMLEAWLAHQDQASPARS
jgi:asparagine synthase (glutamine-hydrolysing)